MSKKRESIKYEQVERTPDNPLGRVGNFEWITVTPEGVGIGAPATSSDMIPEGAELSDSERRKTEAARGARYFNAAMERGSKPFVGAANLLGWTFAPGPMAFASGATGLYNTFSGADGLVDHANTVWNNPNSSAGDLAKAIYPLILKPAFDAAMVAAPVVKVADGTMKINPRILEAEAKVAETGMQHGAQTTESVSQALYPYEATRVIKEGPEVKVWRNYKGWNPATRYRLEGKPSFFERVDDLEPGYHSVHFKTADTFHGVDGRQMLSPEEKKLLFDTYAEDFPEGELLSTYGNLSPGGVHGLNRFKTEYGWRQVGERVVHDTKGNEVTIPVLQKPIKSNTPFIKESEMQVKHPNAYRAAKKYKVQREIGSEPAGNSEDYYLFDFEGDGPGLKSENGLTVGSLSSEEFNQTPYPSRNFIRDIVRNTYDPRGNLAEQHELLSDYVKYDLKDLSPASLRLYDQYAKAMGRRRNYRFLEFPRHVDSGWYGVKDGQSAVFGFFDTVNNPATNKAATVFKPSHFAPATMREGLDMIQKLGESKIPTVFAVTDDLSPMLYKSGQFAKLTQMPQPFNNGIVMKDVMINRSVQPWMAEQILRKGGIQNFSKEELQKLFDQLNFKQAEYHTSNARTTLGDLLDMETIGKLKSIK